MKRISSLSIAILFMTTVAKAQDTSAYTLLKNYYAIKEALVEGNNTAASKKAGDFVKAASSLNTKVVDTAISKQLIEGAMIIGANNDIKKQREAFSPFSDNLFLLAKKVKLSKAPIYRQYCPMKKAYWLSSESEIRNPYYGSMMLNCGKVMETIK
jgi:hypothetical protein